MGSLLCTAASHIIDSPKASLSLSGLHGNRLKNQSISRVVCSCTRDEPGYAQSFRYGRIGETSAYGDDQPGLCCMNAFGVMLTGF